MSDDTLRQALVALADEWECWMAGSKGTAEEVAEEAMLSSAASRLRALLAKHPASEPIPEETADFAWDEVLDAFRRVWPGDDLIYSESPVELIYRLRDERDEAKNPASEGEPGRAAAFVAGAMWACKPENGDRSFVEEANRLYPARAPDAPSEPGHIAIWQDGYQKGVTDGVNGIRAVMDPEEQEAFSVARIDALARPAVDKKDEK